jgi:hypothetical protein
MAVRIGGLARLFRHRDDGPGIVGGLICALLGAASVARTTVNFMIRLRQSSRRVLCGGKSR